MAYPRQDKNVDPLPIMDDGDLAFAGMDMRAPPLVQPGFASSAKNMRIEDGVYWPRKGLFTPTWTRYASDDFPYRASYLRNDAAAWTASYATTYGACIYSDPADGGETWIVRVCASSLLFFRETEIGRIIPFASGLTVSGPVIVFQNFNKLIICRGGSESSLVWSGSFSDAVAELVPSSIASGFAAVPAADYGLAWRERTVLLSGRDTLILSRIADSTQYNETDGIYYVNRGVGDTLRAAVPIGAFSLLILKSQSLHVFSATIADLSDARLDPQAVEMRFDSPKTAVAADNKIWWLDRRGVRTAEVVQVDGDNKVRLQVDSTVSDKIRPLINRINWQYASLFSACVTTDRIYFAVALDTETKPKTLLVWNRIFNQWESYDQWNTTTLSFNIQSLVAGYEWLKEPRIFAASDDGYIACLNFGLGEDHVGWSGTTPTRAAIAQEFVSRGYTAGMNDTKLFKLAKVQIDTWNPGTLGVTAIYDGPTEEDTLNGITRDRTKYFTAAEDFAGTNYDGRFNDPKRQDYSIALDSFTSSSGYSNWAVGNSYVVGNNVFRPTTGHNYRCIANNTSAASNQPDERPDLWVEGGATGASAWLLGYGYTPGNTATFGGTVYTCILSHTATNGNRPEDHIEYWEDLGVDAGFSDSGLFLRPALSAYHDSDADKDGSISVQEYNYFGYLSTGTAGCYIADATEYTGFKRNNVPATSDFHTADLTRNGQFDSADIARVGVLYDAGNYHVDPTGVDGFAPGIDESTDGVEIERFQVSAERRTINREAVWCQVSLTNTQGAFKIRSMAIEAQPGNRTNSYHS